MRHGIKKSKEIICLLPKSLYLCTKDKVVIITNIEEAMKTYDYLLGYHIKPSVQRIAIMDYLLAHKTHPCIDEIYMALSDEIPTLSKTTVYNTLKLFVEHGAAKMLTIDEKNACFDGDTSLHSHFLCRHCGKIFDLPFNEEAMQIKRIGMNGFYVDEVHQYYKGKCPACAQEKDTGTSDLL